MPITQLPPAPQRNSPASFVTRGDAFFGAFGNMITEFNALPEPFFGGGGSVAGLSLVDFTALPFSTFRYLTVVLKDVLLAGAERPLIQIGNYLEAVKTTGYETTSRLIQSTTMSTPTADTTGVALPAVSGFSASGVVTFEELGSNVWFVRGQLALIGSGTDHIAITEGQVTGITSLDKLRFTRLGASNMTSGTVSIRYE